MSREIKIARRELFLYGLAFLAVAFLGVLLGNWFITSRQAGAYGRQAFTRPPSSTSIKMGDSFPSLDLADLDGGSVNTYELIAGRKILIVLLSPGCEPCAQAIVEWSEYAGRIPDDLSIIGIVNCDPVSALVYTSEYDFPFGLYSDTANVLASDYGLVGYPTVIGIDEKGKVMFISEGWREGFSPLDAYKMIARGR